MDHKDIHLAITSICRVIAVLFGFSIGFPYSKEPDPDISAYITKNPHFAEMLPFGNYFFY